jgi:hypothetical protein
VAAIAGIVGAQRTITMMVLTFNALGPSNLAFCGEQSLDTLYLEWLGNTATFVISDGQLLLNLQADAGSMVFSP